MCEVQEISTPTPTQVHILTIINLDTKVGVIHSGFEQILNKK